MTAWQIPTHSFDSPKSLRKTIERADGGIDVKDAPSRSAIQAVRNPKLVSLDARARRRHTHCSRSATWERRSSVIDITEAFVSWPLGTRAGMAPSA